MDAADYRAGVAALYDGEVWGEAFASHWLSLTVDPHQQHLLGLLLQLESEAKVRLRPLLLRHGLSLVESDAQRTAGQAAVAGYAGLAWPAAMEALAALARPYRERYEALLREAPPADVALVGYMVRHEEALVRFAERAATGDPLAEVELQPLLAFPLARVRP